MPNPISDSEVSVGKRKRWRECSTMAESFERWVDKSGDCWLWTGAVSSFGYGIFRYAKKQYIASRAALVIDGRDPGPGMYACHHCDNPLCVNPAHLYSGTPRQNVADARDRGRSSCGEKHYEAKLTEADVRAIRSSEMNNVQTAAIYGVTHSNISQIRRRNTWKHVS